MVKKCLDDVKDGNDHDERIISLRQSPVRIKRQIQGFKIFR